MTADALKDYPALPRDLLHECSQFQQDVSEAVSAPTLERIRAICQGSRKILYAFDEERWQPHDPTVWASRRQAALQDLDTAIGLRTAALAHNPRSRQRLSEIFDKLVIRRRELTAMGA